MAPSAFTTSYRVLDENNVGTEWSLLQALQLVAEHAEGERWIEEGFGGPLRVANMSLAFTPGYAPGRAVQAAIERVYDANVVLVAAAGNHGAGDLSWPAAHPRVIAVAAACPMGDSDFELAPYTNRGAEIDVVAPGGCMDRDVDGDGVLDGVMAASIDPGDPYGTGVWMMAGTSQASAVVSGMVAGVL